MTGPPAAADARRDEDRSAGVPDTEPGGDHAETAAAAALVAGTPHGLVSLLDETSCVSAFCDQVIAADGVIVVPDACADPRFRDRAVVPGEPFVRFYAGFPLRTKQGHVLGTLSVFNTEPGELDATQIRLLTVLAAQVTALLDFGRRAVMHDAVVRDLAASESRYRLLVDHATDIVTRSDRDGTILYISPALMTVLGYDPAEVVGQVGGRRGHPDDEAARQATMAAVAAGHGTQTLTHRAQHADGSWRWLETTVRSLPNGAGDLVEIHSTSRDVTARVETALELVETEQRYRALFEQSPVGLVECDAQGRLVRVNDAFARMLGRAPAELVGRRMRDLCPAPPGELRVAERIAKGEDAPIADRTFVREDGTHVQTTVSSAVRRRADGSVATIVATVVDMTEGNIARAELELLVRELKEARDEAERRNSLLDAVLDTIDVGVAACDEHGRLTMFNRATREYHGIAEHPGLDPADWAEHYDLRSEDGLTPLDAADVPLYRALVDGQVNDVHLTIATPGRPPRVVRCDGRALRGPDGQVTGAVVAMKDVTDLRASEQRFRAAFQNGPTPMARLDPDGTVREANPALRRFLSLPTTRLLGRQLIDLVHPADRPRFERALSGTGALPVEVKVLRSDGTSIWCELATTAGRAPGGTPYVLAQMLDIDARKQSEAALERAANQDPLTGLGNRNVLDRELTRMLAASTGTGACVLFIDLDDFKHVNDTVGHDAGDAVLVETAARLQAALRPGDTATRIGGDEFVVACAVSGRPTDSVVAAALTARLERALCAPVLHEGRPVAVAASVGSALGRPGDTPGELVGRADQAMYARKAARRGTPVSERPDRPTTSCGPGRRSEDGLRDLLRTAVEHNRLRLQYQPVIDVRTGLVVGAEALLRLRDESGTYVAPDRFIPLAEAEGSIATLGRWALNTAFTQTVAWQKQAGPNREFVMGVNISPLQLHDPSLVSAVEQALAATGLAPAAVILEITETRLIPDNPQVRSVMAALVDLGVHLAIDDFGSGYASPGYLAAFPFDVLKIDRRYTSRLAGSGPASRLARGVFAFAREIGLVTIAEGVETPEQATAVRQAGCGLAQGYLWHRPTDPAAVTALLERATTEALRPGPPSGGLPEPRASRQSKHSRRS